MLYNKGDKMFNIVYYTTRRGDEPVKDFVLSLDKKTAIKVFAVIDLLSREGVNLHRPYADHIRGSIRELRIKFSHNAVRILHFFIHGNKIVLVHGFLKKEMALKEKDIQLAEERMKDWIARYGGKRDE